MPRPRGRLRREASREIGDWTATSERALNARRLTRTEPGRRPQSRHGPTSLQDTRRGPVSMGSMPDTQGGPARPKERVARLYSMLYVVLYFALYPACKRSYSEYGRPIHRGIQDMSSAERTRSSPSEEFIDDLRVPHHSPPLLKKVDASFLIFSPCGISTVSGGLGQPGHSAE